MKYKNKILYSMGYTTRDPFNLFDRVSFISDPGSLTKDGVLLLHGGEDIATSIYGQEPNGYCHARHPSRRDMEEMEMIDVARKIGIPIIGICRGAQLMCAIDGGELVQHIVGHTSGRHDVIDVDTGVVYTSTSAHHQMMVPNKKYANKVLAICAKNVQGYDRDGEPFEIKQVPEVVYFPNLRGIGVQGHPEWQLDSKYNKYLATQIEQYLLKE